MTDSTNRWITATPHGTPPPQVRRRFAWLPRFTLLRLIHYFLILFAFANILVVTIQCFDSIGHGWGSFSFNYNFKINGISAAASGAGLKMNDQLVLVNGLPPPQFEEALGQKKRIDIGNNLPSEDMSIVVYTIARNDPGSAITSQIVVKAESLTFDLGDLLSFYGVGLLVGWLMFLIGVFIYFLKQDERSGQVFMLAMVNASLVVIVGYEGVYTYRVHPLDFSWFEGLFGFALALLAATTFQMAGNFPQVKRVIVRSPSLQYIVYPISILLGAIYIVQVQVKVNDIENFEVYDTKVDITALVVGLLTVALLYFFGAVINDWRISNDPTVRRQSRIVLIGSLLGIGPLIFLYVIPSYLFEVHFIDYNTGYAFLLVFPIAVAYAIIRYKLFDLNYLLRRSFAYVISSALVLGIYFALVAFLQDLFTRLTGQSTAISIIITTVIIAIAFQPLRDRLQRLVDRFFFRERFIFRQAMLDFGNQVRDIYDVGELSRKLVLDVTAIMDLEDAALYLKPPGQVAGQAMRLSDAASQLDPTQVRRGIRFSADSDINAAPQQGWTSTYELPLELHDWLIGYNRPLNMAVIPTDIPRAAQPTLQGAFRRGIIIIIPLVSEGQLFGLMLLERKRSGAGVLREDIDLLNAIIPQAVLTIRNSQLIAEATERERIASELEIAREIQQGLFPKSVPQPPGLQIGAICLPAQETSGDFYDFVELGNKLGIIVADACGKSVPAAMMMSLARNTMRSEIGHYIEPAPALTEANRWLVKDLSEMRYVALTYLLLDTDAHALLLGNAGGLSPILRRDGECRYLQPAGMTLPLGIEDGLAYQQCRLDLCPGDLIVAYTDGVVEATNANGEMFSFERLEQLIAEYDADSGDADGLIKHILARLQEYSGGGAQADDITIVAIQVRLWLRHQQAQP